MIVGPDLLRILAPVLVMSALGHLSCHFAKVDLVGIIILHHIIFHVSILNQHDVSLVYRSGRLVIMDVASIWL